MKSIVLSTRPTATTSSSCKFGSTTNSEPDPKTLSFRQRSGGDGTRPPGQADRSRHDKYAIILYMTTIPIATARANLSQLVEEASSTHERVEITKNGQRAAVLLGADDYDSMMETIAVLSDSDLLVAHLRGLEEIEAGDVVDAGALATLLNETGQLRGPG